jgi:predicted MFS family arabinose efflux permease
MRSEPGVREFDARRAEQATLADSSASPRRRIISYFALLNLSVGLGTPLTGLAAIPINYFLKDKLGLSPFRLAIFMAIASAPTYVGFLFGFLRDRWRPQIWGDRAYLLLGGVAALGAYLWLSRAAIDYYDLLRGVMIAGVAYTIVAAAAQGLMTVVAQSNLMTGRLSAVFGFGIFVPLVVSACLGGWLVAHVSARGTFILAACATAAIVAQAFWQLDGGTASARRDFDVHESGLSAITRLAAHRPIWPATLIWFLWNFSPGWGTPMFYHLTQTVKISSQLFGTFTALQSGSFLPTTLLYGVVCRRRSLAQLLWWGTLVAILQGPIMFFADSASRAIVVAVGFGLFGGFATAAYMDLIMRSCPEGLEGTGVMLSGAALAVASNSGNLFGSWIYDRGGFALAVIVTTLATALIVPALWLVPANVTATREGESAASDLKEAKGLLDELNA